MICTRCIQRLFLSIWEDFFLYGGGCTAPAAMSALQADLSWKWESAALQAPLLNKRISEVWHSYITTGSSCAEQSSLHAQIQQHRPEKNLSTNCFNLLNAVSLQRFRTQEGHVPSPAVLWMDRSMCPLFIVCSCIFTKLQATLHCWENRKHYATNHTLVFWL